MRACSGIARIHVAPGKELPWATVVGVVADTKLAPAMIPSADQWYIPAQQPALFSALGLQEPSPTILPYT